MSGIEIVGSIFSVVAFGTSLVTGLYKAADNAMHARDQISSMAKHVSHSIAVLKHLAQVLESERHNCSKDVFRDVRKIRRSSKRTFKEIHSTIQPRTFRRLYRTHWLFKKSKACELEARLSSQQSMLHCIIQTLTIAKLGQMDSRSAGDAYQIADLSIEIRMLKAFVVENFSNLADLGRHDTVVAAENGPDLDHHEDQFGSMELSQPRFGPSADSEPSNTVHGINDSGVVSSDTESDSSNTEGKVIIDETPTSRRLPVGPLVGTSGVASSRESEQFLQIVRRPYKPHEHSQALQLISKRFDHGWISTPTAVETTETVRFLLDKWTTTGSAPLSDILEQGPEEEAMEGEYDYITEELQQSSVGRAPPMLEEAQPQSRESFTQSHRQNFRDIWIHPHIAEQGSVTRFGDEILYLLRSEKGGIMYSKRNTFSQVYYIDEKPMFTYYLVPKGLIPFEEAVFTHTDLGPSLVLREALNLLGYSYSQVLPGQISVSGDLDLAAIEELVRLSYRSVERALEGASHQVIIQRAWQKDVDAARRYMTEHPQPSTTGQVNFDKAIKCHSYGLQNANIPDSRLDPPRVKSSLEKSIPSPEPSPQSVAHTRPKDLQTPYDAQISRSSDDKDQSGDLPSKAPQMTQDSKKRDFPLALSTERISEMQHNIQVDIKMHELETHLKGHIETYKQLEQKWIQAEKDNDSKASSNLLHQAMPHTQGLIDDVRSSLQKLLIDDLQSTVDRQRESCKHFSAAIDSKFFRDIRIVFLDHLIRRRTLSIDFQSAFKEYQDVVTRPKKSNHDYYVQKGSDLIYYVAGGDEARLDELKKAVEKAKSTKKSDSKSVKVDAEDKRIDGDGPAPGLSPKKEKSETDLGREEKKKSKEKKSGIADSVIVISESEHQANNEWDNWVPARRKDREDREAKKPAHASSSIGYKPPEIEDEADMDAGSSGSKRLAKLGLGAAAVVALHNTSNKAARPRRSHRALSDENYRKRS